MKSKKKMPGAKELKQMMDIMRLGWWTADFSTETYTCSDRIVEFLNMDTDRMTFKEFLQMIRPDYRTRIAEQFSSIRFVNIYEQVFPIQIGEKSVWVHSKLLNKKISPLGELQATGTIQIIKNADEEQHKQTKKYVEEMIDRQNSIYTSLLAFLESEDIAPVISTALKDVMVQFKGSRIILMEYDYEKGIQNCTYDVVESPDNAVPIIPEFPFELIPWWTQKIQAGIPIIASDVNQLPEEAISEKKILIARGTCSLLAAPLMGPDRAWGYITLINKEMREWSAEDYQRFSSLASLISICMQFHASQAKAHLNQQDIANLYKYMPAGYVRVKMIGNGKGNWHDYTYLDANDAATRLLGVPMNQLKGRKATEVGQVISFQQQEICVVANTDQHLTTNFHIEESNKHFQAVIFSPAKDQIAVLFTDITEMINAQIIIQQSEEKLSNIYRNLPVGIELYDKNGVLVDLNDKELEIFGLRRKEDALGINVFDNPNIPDEVKKKLQLQERVEFTLTYDFGIVGEYYSTIRDKTIFLVTIAVPLFNLQGELINYMFINIDNTETTTAHQRIEAFEEMTALIGEFAQVGYANFDIYTRLGTALNSWYINLGEEPGIPLDQVVGVLNHVHPDDKVAVREFFNEVKQGKARHLRHDVRVIASDGILRWTRLNIMVRSFNPEEKKIAMVCVNYDITALKQTEHNLIMARDKAQTSDKLKSAFLANMSHEIRTPLNAIVGFSTLLTETGSPDERNQYISIVQENSELLLNLISDILDISKIEAGTMEFTPTVVDIRQLCREVIQTFSIKAAKGIKLRFDENLPLIFMEGDKNRITQVLSNFMTNALKFTFNGSITLSYEIISEREIRFTVSDTGIGIAHEKQEEIFSRFVKLNSFAQGTGLGLSICQSLVEKMGGRIGVNSEPDKGSSFWFTHPFDPTL